MMETILRLYTINSHRTARSKSNQFTNKKATTQNAFFVPQNQGTKLIACKNGLPKEVASFVKSEYDLEQNMHQLKDTQVVEFDQTFKELYNNLAFYTYAFKHKIFNLLQNQPCDIIMMGTKQAISSCLDGTTSDKGLLQLCIEDMFEIIHRNGQIQVTSKVITFEHNTKREILDSQTKFRSIEEVRGFLVTVNNKIENNQIKEYQIQFNITNHERQISHLSFSMINDPTNVDFYTNYNSNVSLICLIPNNTVYFQKYLEQIFNFSQVNFCSEFKNQKEKQDLMKILSQFEKLLQEEGYKNVQESRELYLEINKFREKGFNNFLVDQILNDYIEKLYSGYDYIKQKKIALKMTLENKLDEIQQLQETSEQCQQEITIMFNENKFILQENNKLKVINSSQEMIMQYKEMASAMENKIDDNSRVNDELNQNLQNQLQEQKINNEQLQEKNEKLTKELQDKQDEIQNHEHQVQNLLVIKTDQFQKIKEYEIEINGLKSRYDQEYDEKARLRSTLLKDNQFLKNQNQIISQKLDQINDAYQKSLTENEKIVEEMRILEGMANRQRKNECDEIEKSQKKVQDKIQRKNEKIKEMNQAFDEFKLQLQKKDQYIENLEMKLKGSEKRIDEQQTFIEEQTNNVVRKNQECDKLSQALQNLNQAHSKLQQENEYMKNQNHSCHQELNTLKFQFEDLQKQNYAIQKNYSESDQTQKQINRELQNENSELTQQLIQMTSQSEKQNLDTMDYNLSLLTSQLKRKTEENTFLNNQLMELQVATQYHTEKIQKQEILNQKQRDLLSKIVSKMGSQDHGLYTWVKRKSMDLQELD